MPAIRSGRPTGRTLGFFADDKLKRIDAAGGKPLVITDVQNGRGGTWNADGVRSSSRRCRSVRSCACPLRGGAAEPATESGATPPDPNHRFPQFLPDGKRFVFSSTLGTVDTNGVFLTSLDKTPPFASWPTQGVGRFAPPATLLAVGQGALQAYPFDPEAGRVEGEPSIVTQGFTSRRVQLDVRRLEYRSPGVPHRKRRSGVSWSGSTGRVARSGRVGEPTTDFIASPELSPDEQSVAVFLQRTGDNDIWIIELARNLARRVTDGEPADAHPLWDPDEQHVVFFSRRFGSGGPTRQPLAGGQASPLFTQRRERCRPVVDARS